MRILEEEQHKGKGEGSKRLVKVRNKKHRETLRMLKKLMIYKFLIIKNLQKIKLKEKLIIQRGNLLMKIN